jgi:hypothetical protein
MATIKRVETMISMHQMDDEDDPKANTVARVVRARRPLPLLTYAKHRQVRSIDWSPYDRVGEVNAIL